MAERKVINKYYPPDFDPSKITKKPKLKGQSAAAALQTVRLMAPFSMRCTTCGEFIYKGKKFNARKQATGEQYLGVKIVRFYIRCTRCSGEIRFKTEPKIGDYITEYGAVRNHEPWREKKLEDETLDERLERLEKEEKEKREKEEHQRLFGPNSVPNPTPGEDIMADLEARVNETKREIAIQNELDSIRMRNARIERATDGEGLLDKAKDHVSRQKSSLVDSNSDDEDSQLASAAFKHTTSGNIIRPVASLEPSASGIKTDVAGALSGAFQDQKHNPRLLSRKAPATKRPSALGVIVKKKKSLI